MFIVSATVDDNQLLADEVYTGAQLSKALILTLVRRLDGKRHTLLILRAANDEGHMALGGAAELGLVVYCTRDNETFHDLVTWQPKNVGTVQVVAGGQPADYDARLIVTVDEAIEAAQMYASAGSLSTAFEWRAM